MSEIIKITSSTPTVLGNWLWNAEKGEWHDSARLGTGARFAPDVFGYTHMTPKPAAEDALREACDWIENRLAVEGHPMPASMVLLSDWRNAIRPPQIRP